LVEAYTTRSVKTMSETEKDKIISCGVPIELYTDGMITLGPMNKNSITKFANICTAITQNELKLFPSLFTERIVDLTTNKHDKQDFREMVDGPPGSGKSTSAIYGCCRYAMDAADRFGQDPKDYFTLDNCALLQDTEGVTSLMDELDKEQAVLIDDAGVTAGNKDFLTQSNKNLAAIMATCRTKRWYIGFTAPLNKQMDLSIREVVYCRGNIYKPCHEAGFNILQQKRINMRYIKSRYVEMNPHYFFNDTKVNLYAYFTPDLLDPYKGILKDYEKIRDAAADSLIHDRATQEKERKNPTDKREKKFQDILEIWEPVVFKLTHDSTGRWLDRRELHGKKNPLAYSVGRIKSETGLNERQIDRIIAEIKKKGK
jgi:hypothetical protein